MVLRLVISLSLVLTLSVTGQAQGKLDEEYRKVSNMLKVDMDSALVMANQLLEKAKEANELRIVILSLWLKAYVSYQTDQPDDAVLNYLEAIRYIDELKLDFEASSTLCGNLANILREYGSFELAIEYYNKAIEIEIFERDTFQIVRLNYHLARVYREKGNYAKSLDVLNAILSLSTPKSEYYYNILNRVSVSLFYLEEYDSVLAITRTLLNAPSASNLIDDAYQNRALTFSKLGLQDSTIFNYNRALKIKKGDTSQYRIVSKINTIVDFSDFYISIGAFEEAKGLLHEGEELMKEVPVNKRNEEWYFELFNLLSRVYSELGDVEKSEWYSDKYDSELEAFTRLHKRYNMDLIVQNYFDQKEKEERAASLKFYGGVVSGGLLIFLTSFFMIGKIRRNRTNRKLERNEAEKKLAELKALKAQINPHFLFNSLNSIQSFILEDEKNMADEYLVKYGKLIRKILDHSNELTVTLNDELEALQLYVELEQLRIKEGFDFEVIIQESIDPYNAMIPSMVIQPFIENAIWHGVSGLNGKGKIKLTISEHDDLIEVRVEDNGVGFDTNSYQNSASKGVRLVRERLELLKESAGQESVVEIEGQPGEGTIVVLRFSNNIDE
ncbi:MAG: histidine kinase [Cyclobacteriaceae bacterium]